MSRIEIAREDHGKPGALHKAIERARNTTLPWARPELEGWSIVGMNHYHVDGSRRLFVAMVKDGRCIKREGLDTRMLWDELAHLAKQIEQ